MATNNFDPSKYGATPFDPAGQGATPAEAEHSISQKGSDILRAIGLGAVPNIAANTLDIGKSIGTGQKISQMEDYNNPFRTQEQTAEQAAKGPLQGAEDAAGLATYTPLPGMATAGLASKVPWLAGSGLVPTAARLATTGAIRGELYGGSQHDALNPVYPASGALMETLLGLIFKGGLTKKQVYNNMEKAADKSDQPTSLHDIYTESKHAMPDRMKATYDLNQKEADKILRTLTETKGNPDFGNVDLSPKELLAWRSHLSPEASQNYVERLLGFLGHQMNPKAGLEAKTADVLRSVLSEHLKDAAPEVGTLGQLYGLYNNPAIGPAWSWPLRAGAAVGLGGSAAKMIGGFK